MWSEVARARVPGPLAPFADGFRAELDRLGYRLNSRESKVNEMSRLSRWLMVCCRSSKLVICLSGLHTVSFPINSYPAA
jgi:hypothetical protein